MKNNSKQIRILQRATRSKLLVVRVRPSVRELPRDDQFGSDDQSEDSESKSSDLDFEPERGDSDKDDDSDGESDGLDGDEICQYRENIENVVRVTLVDDDD